MAKAKRMGFDSGSDEGEAPESLYADELADAGTHAVWNGDLYKWSENHYAPVPESDACAHAFEWLRRFPKRRTAKTASSAVASAKLAVPRINSRMIDGLPETQEEYRCIIPTEGMWIEVVFRKDEKGRTIDAGVYLKTPTRSLDRAVMSSVPIRVSGKDGSPYVPAAMPSDSMFGRFLSSSFPCPKDGPEPSPEGIEAAESLLSIQEYAGYTLLVGRSDQKSHLWMGDGANGKGVMSGLIQRFHRTHGVDLSNLDGFALNGIQDATLAVVDETPKDGFNEGRLKSLLGEGLTPVDRKFKDSINVVSRAKWIINSNQEFGIRCRNSTGGFWRRFIFVEWKHVIPEADRREGLDRAIFEREGKLVLDWMLVGLLRYLGRGGRLFESDSSARIKRSAIANSDIVGAWIADHGGIGDMLTPARSKSSQKDDVYARFQEYCQANGRHPVNSHEFWTRAKKLFGNALTEGQAKNDAGKMVRWVNIDPVARAGTGHLTSGEERGLGPAPDFGALGPVQPRITLLEEIYGLSSARLETRMSLSASTVATAPRQTPMKSSIDLPTFPPSDIDLKRAHPKMLQAFSEWDRTAQHEIGLFMADVMSANTARSESPPLSALGADSPSKVQDKVSGGGHDHR